MISDTARRIFSSDDEGRKTERLESTWVQPVQVNDSIRQEAQTALRRLRGIMVSSPRSMVARWVTELSLLCKDSETKLPVGPDRIEAYARQLTDMFPMAAFTKTALRAASRSNKGWWPALDDVAGALEAETRGQQTLLARLQAVADTGTENDPRARRQRWLEDQEAARIERQAAADAQRRQLLAELVARGEAEEVKPASEFTTTEGAISEYMAVIDRAAARARERDKALGLGRRAQQ